MRLVCKETQSQEAWVKQRGRERVVLKGRTEWSETPRSSGKSWTVMQTLISAIRRFRFQLSKSISSPRAKKRPLPPSLGASLTQ